MREAHTYEKGRGEYEARQAHNYLLELGSISVRFATVERAPRYPNGDRETDVEHSYHLALSAVELAANFYPELDAGLVAQFSLVHDLPEIYTGDVRTFRITEEERRQKEAAESAATKRLLTELPPHMAELLCRYEEQQEPEARFVRFVDKFLPAIINIMAGEANTFKEDYGVSSLEEIQAGRQVNAARLQAMFPEFPFLHMLQDLVNDTSEGHTFGNRRYPHPATALDKKE